MAADARWLERLDRTSRPIYLGLVKAIEAAIRSGELQAGDQLPPQREVAAAIGIDFTTVTRAYALARERGLVEAAVGRGTFVRRGAAEDEAGRVDLSMNLPPPPLGVSLATLLADTTAEVLRASDPATLMAYHADAGTFGQKAAGAAWLQPVLGRIDPERVLVCPGAQAALTAALATLCQSGDRLIVEPLTYPGLRTLARQLGVQLVPCPGDDEGVVPDALDTLCGQGAAAIYLVPTMQNPTATTMSEARRHAVVEVARRHGAWIVEDDPYSRLMTAPPPALAALYPEQTLHVATLSKCLSPGLRIAFTTCPDAAIAVRLAAALHAVAQMPAPLMAAVVARWMREGAAERLLKGVRAEACARRALAAEILPGAVGDEASLHVWLPLHQSSDPAALRAAGEAKGLSLLTAEAFATGRDHRNGVRISLGGPAKRTVLERALIDIRTLVSGL